MILIWLGVLLVFGGVLQMAYQPICKPGSGFGFKSNWPGLVLVALGGAFLFTAAVI